MKTLEASILTFNLDRVRQELHALGLDGITLSKALSVQRSSAPGSVARARDFLPRIQVQVVAPEHAADRVEAILRDAM
jgi:nitrogen regulatory protein P-II 1